MENAVDVRIGCDDGIFRRFLEDVLEYSRMAERCRFGDGADPSRCSKRCCDCPTDGLIKSQNELVGGQREFRPRKQPSDAAGPSAHVDRNENDLKIKKNRTAMTRKIVTINSSDPPGGGW